MISKLKKEIQKAVIGHNELIDAMLIALFSDGHILVEGVPGVAKTTAINTLAKVIGFNFKRVQFTPDLLPSDIIGNEILDLKTNEYKTIGEQSFKLKEPFMVLATANPIDQEGTYELPEASLDRFLLKVEVGYNNFSEELEIMELSANNGFKSVEQILDFTSFLELKNQIASVHIDGAVKEYMLKIIFATREPKSYNLENIAKYIEFGVSPRGSIALYKTSRAIAFIEGRDFVTPADVARASYLAIGHRIKLSYEAIVDGINSKQIIRRILETIPAP